VKELFATKFPRIKDYWMRAVDKNYAFEMPVPNGTSKFLEVWYKFHYKALPPNMWGQTFKHIFGVNTSPLEHLIIQKKIMGPCWITIKGA